MSDGQDGLTGTAMPIFGLNAVGCIIITLIKQRGGWPVYADAFGVAQQRSATAIIHLSTFLVNIHTDLRRACETRHQTFVL
jgi:hypothetical protein